jgi:hypothetical protein
MLRTLTDKLYSKGSAVKWFKSKNPDEEIVFSSAATILETKEATSTGWSLQRFFQHRGVVIVTRNQIALKDSLFSISTVFFSVFLIFSITIFLQNQDLSAFLGVVVFGIFIVQRLPYEKQIPLKDIQKINIRELRSFTGKYSLLTIHLKDKAINIVPAQNFKQEIVDLISSHAE